ncbi:MAG TPA: hypothetical protein PKD55_06895 [Bellilinea sp.]|nr:hypothetical protein [Bellilinea sp.]
MTTIRTTNDIPGTYFRMSEVAPHFDADALVIFNGEGTRRSWGRPQVTSTVVVDTGTFLAVHVGFSHKYRGGQGWFYFTSGQRRTWAQLSDELRTLVLDNEHKAPYWAKSPGKLRAETKKPSQSTQTAYKLVKVEGDRMLSLYDGKTEYTLNKRLTQKARDEHGGGYYAYATAEQVRAAWANGTLVPARCSEGVEQLALLKCEISGTVIGYGNKLAATYLKPVEVVETFSA